MVRFDSASVLSFHYDITDSSFICPFLTKSMIIEFVRNFELILPSKRRILRLIWKLYVFRLHFWWTAYIVIISWRHWQLRVNWALFSDDSLYLIRWFLIMWVRNMFIPRINYYPSTGHFLTYLKIKTFKRMSNMRSCNPLLICHLNKSRGIVCRIRYNMLISFKQSKIVENVLHYIILRSLIWWHRVWYMSYDSISSGQFVHILKHFLKSEW